MHVGLRFRTAFRAPRAQLQPPEGCGLHRAGGVQRQVARVVFLLLEVEVQRVLSERLTPSSADKLVVRANELCHPAEISLGQLAVVMSDDAASTCCEPEPGRILGRPLDGNVHMDRLVLLARPEEDDVGAECEQARYQATSHLSSGGHSASSNMSGALFLRNTSNSSIS